MTAEPPLAPPRRAEADERVPPHRLDHERQVLGGMLLSPDAVEAVTAILPDSGAFWRPAHATVYDAILTCLAEGRPVGVQAIIDVLTRQGDLSRCGGALGVLALVEGNVLPAQAGYSAERVLRYARKRSLIEVGTQIVQRGWSVPAEDVAEAEEAAMEALTAAVERAELSGPVHVADVVVGAVDAMEALANGEAVARPRLPTGLADLDDALNGGLLPGQVMVVGARAGMGKSLLALGVARAAAIEHGRPALLFSLEMGRDEIAARILAAEARVPLTRLDRGQLDEAEWARVAARMADVVGAPLWIDDTPSLSMAAIHARTQALARRRGGLGVVVIDYLQLVTGGGRHGNREQEVAAVSRATKLLAKETDCPVVLVAQVNRGPEGRADKRPQLSDLRESGSIESDSDVVVLLYRDDVYDPESARAGEIDLIVAKNRRGPTVTVAAAFQGHYARVVSMA